MLLVFAPVDDPDRKAIRDGLTSARRDGLKNGKRSPWVTEELPGRTRRQRAPEEALVVSADGTVEADYVVKDKGAGGSGGRAGAGGELVEEQADMGASDDECMVDHATALEVEDADIAGAIAECRAE